MFGDGWYGFGLSCILILNLSLTMCYDLFMPYGEYPIPVFVNGLCWLFLMLLTSMFVIKCVKPENRKCLSIAMGFICLIISWIIITVMSSMNDDEIKR